MHPPRWLLLLTPSTIMAPSDQLTNTPPENNPAEPARPTASTPPPDLQDPSGLDTKPGNALSPIQQYLHQGMTEAIETSETFAKHIEKQAKFIKILALLFATFSAYLQVRQIYVGNASSQQASKFSAWEMVQRVQGEEVTTSAGLAIALKTLANACEPLSGIDLTGKFLPSIKLAPPKPSATEKVLSLVGSYFFAVPSHRGCGEANLTETQGNDSNTLDLRGINFKEAKLQHAQFTNTDLTGASFQEADLTGAAFRGAQPKLEEINFQKARLSEVNFSKANLNGANFSNALFSDANLGGANLSDADLSNTIILSTNLSATEGLTREQLTGESAPLLCNSELPAELMTADAVMDRVKSDCTAIAAPLHERYPDEFPTLDNAEAHVKTHYLQMLSSR